MRIGFRMKVNPGSEQEYRDRHNPIWPELEQVLFDHGVRTYTIFHDPQTNDLFGYVEVDSLETFQQVANNETCRKWWDHMAPLMPTNPDNSPVMQEMVEVFHIER